MCNEKKNEITKLKFTKFQMPLKKERSHRIKISEISYAIKERKNEVTELKFTKFHMPLKKERMKSPN